MLAALLFAALMLTARPPTLLAGGEVADYGAWLDETFKAKHLKNTESNCRALSVDLLAFRSYGEGEFVDPFLARLKGSAGGTGLWLERARVSGCGTSTLENLIVGPKPGGGWEGASLMPGESLASPTIQHMALADFMPIVRPPADCTAPKLVLADVIVISRPARSFEPWSERWPIKLCGIDISVDIRFTPLGDGFVNRSVSPAPGSEIPIRKPPAQ